VFEGLSERLEAIFRRLSSHGRLTESDVNEVAREIRVALLEADVNLAVVKDFIAKVKERAVGADVLASLTPAQSVIKPSVIMLVGLQGSGKTTHAAKLGLRLKEQGRRSLLVAADVYRPAAIEQLRLLAKQIDLPVFGEPGVDPVDTAREAVAEAKRVGISTVIIDTAGRLQIDDELMAELERIKTATSPREILFVADAMTGQEATGVARGFNDRLGITGVILTKMDGDARGGAALSIHALTGTPIKFVGVGEKVNALEAFHPDRLASRILGMGDMLTLIEKTQDVYSKEQARSLEQKVRKNEFTLDDFLEQLRQVRKLGSMSEIVKMIPGMSKMIPKDVQLDKNEVRRVEAIICSMTRGERRRPEVLNASRRKRIAAGSGTQVPDVNRLVKNFEASRQMMKQLGGKRPRFPLG
jgi:signal recognition particle subunit SRP54